MQKKILSILIILLFLTGCCGPIKYEKLEADDEISRAICEAVDSEDIYYQGKRVTSEEVTYYRYLLYYEEIGQLEQIVACVNEILKETDDDFKINIDCWLRVPGGQGNAINLANYSDANLPEPDYEALQMLSIGSGRYGTYGSIYTKPDTYKNLPDIRYLEVHKDMQETAELEGVDWYEYWPDLERVEVYSFE